VLPVSNPSVVLDGSQVRVVGSRLQYTEVVLQQLCVCGVVCQSSKVVVSRVRVTSHDQVTVNSSRTSVLEGF